MPDLKSPSPHESKMPSSFDPESSSSSLSSSSSSDPGSKENPPSHSGSTAETPPSPFFRNTPRSPSPQSFGQQAAAANTVESEPARHTPPQRSAYPPPPFVTLPNTGHFRSAKPEIYRVNGTEYTPFSFQMTRVSSGRLPTRGGNLSSGR